MPGLQNTGAISLDDLQNEFGNTNPIEMSEYYRGLEVPDALENVGVPLSGTLNLSDFYGAVDITYATAFSPLGEQIVNNTTPMQQSFTTTTGIIIPPYVTKISMVAIGGGGGGAHARAYSWGSAVPSGGGGGGGLAWKNNITVVPNSYHVITVGAGGAGAGRGQIAGTSSGVSGGGTTGSNWGIAAGGGAGGTATFWNAGGTYTGDGGGAGGRGMAPGTYAPGGGAGGAGGYNGTGGDAGSISGSGGAGGGGGGGSSAQFVYGGSLLRTGGSGGSTGTMGQGTSGAAGSYSYNTTYAGSGGGGSFLGVTGGGGGGGQHSPYYGGYSGGTSGQPGAARIIYTEYGSLDVTSGAGRSYPSNAGDATHTEYVSRYDEGTDIDVTITTTSVVDNTSLYWEIVRSVGSVNAPAIREDMSSFTGVATIISNSAVLTFTINDDYTTDGATDEEYHVTLRVTSSSGPIVHTSETFKVTDTSIPTYVLSGPTDVKEGQTFTVTLDALGTLNNTYIPYTITGVSSADIDGASLTGNFYIQNETASIIFTATYDNTPTAPNVESETFTLSLNNGEDDIVITILDISYELSITSSHTTQVAGDEFKVGSATTDTIVIPAGITHVSAVLIGGGGGGMHGLMSGGSGGAGGGGATMWINSIPVSTSDSIQLTGGSGGTAGSINGANPVTTYNGTSGAGSEYIYGKGYTFNNPTAGASAQIKKNNVLIATAGGGAPASNNTGGAGGTFSIEAAFDDLQYGGNAGDAGESQISSDQAGGGGGAGGYLGAVGSGGTGGSGRSDFYRSDTGYNYTKVANGGGGGGVGEFGVGNTGSNGYAAPALYVTGSGSGGNLQINYSVANGGAGGSGGGAGVSNGTGGSYGGGGGGGAGGTMATYTVYSGGSQFNYGVYAKGSGGAGGNGAIRLIYGKGRAFPDQALTGPTINDVIIQEGETIELGVVTTNIVDGTVLNWVVTPSATNLLGTISDFTSQTGTVTITSNAATFNVENNNDEYPDGGESYKIELYDGATLVSESPNLYFVNSSSTTLSLTPSGHYGQLGSTNHYYHIVGNTLTITITDSGGELADGFQVPYTMQGSNVTSSDLASGSLIGTLTLASGTASMTFTFANSASGKTFRIQSDVGVGQGNPVAFQALNFEVAIQSASIQENQGHTTRYELENFGLAFSASGYLLSSQIPIKLTGTGVSAADINGAINPNGTYNYPHMLMNLTGGFSGWSGTLSTTFADDSYGEGNEAITFEVPGTTASCVITVLEDVYTLTSNSSIDEGQIARWYLTTTGVTPGTLIPYTITGINNADLSSGSLTGNFTVPSAGGTAEINITLANDLTLEGTETATLTLNNAPTLSANVVIADTSVPTYALAASATQIYEGQTVQFTLTTTGIPNGTLLGYTITNIQSNDITTSLTGNFSVTSGIATINITASDTDALAESDQTMTLSLDNGLAPQSPQVTILAPTYNLAIIQSSSGPSVNEGAELIFELTTQGIASGTTFGWTITGIGTADLVPGDSLTGNFSVGSYTYNTTTRIGKSRQTIRPYADVTTEGPEVLTFTMDNGTGSFNVTINDTSIKPHVGMSGTQYTINETTVTNVPIYANQVIPNKSIYYYIEPNGANPFPSIGEFTSPSLTSINASKYRGTLTINGSSATIGFQMTADQTTEVTESFKITFNDTFIDGTPTDRDLDDTIIISDTSYTPGKSWTFFNPGSESWVVPAGITGFHACCIGAGGKGGNTSGTSWTVGGGGGGGGGIRWTSTEISCTPGETLTVVTDSVSSRVMRGGTTLIYASSGSDSSGNTGGSGGGSGGGAGQGAAGGDGGNNSWITDSNGLGGGGGGAAGWNENGGQGGQYSNNTSAANQTFTYAGAGGSGARRTSSFGSNGWTVFYGAGGWGGGQRPDYAEAGTNEQDTTSSTTSLHSRQGDGWKVWGTGNYAPLAVKGTQYTRSTITFNQESSSHGATDHRWLGAGGGGGSATMQSSTYYGAKQYLNDSVNINWPNLLTYNGPIQVVGKPGGTGCVRITVGGPGTATHPLGRGYPQTWWSG